MSYDAIIIGGGPAGLSAALQLRQSGHGVLLLDKESFGGPIINVEWIENYPRPGEKIAGAMLASELVNQAEQAGVDMEVAEVIEVEPYSGCISVTCADGRTHTSSVVVLAGGLSPRALDIPGEEEYQGKGVIHCAMCDAGLYRDRIVAVCGGGNAALIEAMFLARFASQVHVIEKHSALAATPALQALAAATSNLEVHVDQVPVEIVGTDGVTALTIQDATTGKRHTMEVYGILVRVGFSPSTAFLEGVVELDDAALIQVNDQFETDVECMYAAGDIRHSSPRDVVTAIADGRSAASSAHQRLCQLKGS